MQKRSKRLCLALAVLLSVSMVLVALVPAVEAASYKKGSIVNVFLVHLLVNYKLRITTYG